MGSIWQLLFNGGQKGAADPALDTAVERTIDAIDPKLKFAGGYPQRYRPAVAHALDYVRQLADRVPGPVTINREAYVKDPFIRAIFASPDEFHNALCLSRAMQGYVHQHGCHLGTPVYALLGMRRQEKGTFGTELVGEVLRHDVPQTSVIFSDHTLTNIAPSAAEARELLTWSFLDSLLAEVQDRIEALKAEKTYLEQKRSDIAARLHSADAGSRARLQTELDALLPKIQEATAALDLRRYAEYLDAVLLQPEAHLRLEDYAVCLDDMNIKRDACEGTREVHLTDLLGRDRRRWSIVLLHCQQPGAASIGENLDNATRWLNI